MVELGIAGTGMDRQERLGKVGRCIERWWRSGMAVMASGRHREGIVWIGQEWGGEAGMESDGEVGLERSKDR